MIKVFDQKASLKVIICNRELPEPPVITFTGDAISVCHIYLKEATYINLDEWEWHEESNGNGRQYIITSYKGDLEFKKDFT